MSPLWHKGAKGPLYYITTYEDHNVKVFPELGDDAKKYTKFPVGAKFINASRDLPRYTRILMCKNLSLNEVKQLRNDAFANKARVNTNKHHYGEYQLIDDMFVENVDMSKVDAIINQDDILFESIKRV